MLRVCALLVILSLFAVPVTVAKEIIDRDVQEWLINEPSTSISSHKDGVQQIYDLSVSSSSTAWVVLPGETCGEKIASEVAWCYMQRWENESDVPIKIVTLGSDDINFLMSASLNDRFGDVQEWLSTHCMSSCVELDAGDAYSIYDLSIWTPRVTAEGYAFFLHTWNGWEFCCSMPVSFWYLSPF